MATEMRDDYGAPLRASVLAQTLWMNEAEKIVRHSDSGDQPDIDNVDRVFAYWE